MSLIQRFDNEYNLFARQFDEIAPKIKSSNLILFLVILTIAVGYILVKYFLNITLIIWIAIPIVIIPIYLSNYQFKGRIRYSIFMITVILSFGLFGNKGEVRDLIGYNLIAGYSSHIEIQPVTHNYGTDIQETTDEEVQIWEASTWTGNLIMNVFSIVYWMFVVLIPYFTWKLLHPKDVEIRQAD